MFVTDTIEYKSDWKESYLEKICGMANADGGSFFVGLDNDGNPVGLTEKEIRKLLDDIPNQIISGLGIYNVKVKCRTSEGKDSYIEVIVPRCDRLVSYRGRSFIRVGTSTHLINPDERRDSLSRMGAISWDGQTVDGVSIDELEEDSFRIFRDNVSEYAPASPVRGYDRERILEELKLVRNGKLTTAAVLLFHHRPDSIIPGAYVRVGKMESNADVSSKFELHGSLMKLARDIFEVLDIRYLASLITYNGNDRLETPPYPAIAKREVVLNALMHNDWSAVTPIRFRVFDDHLDISNRAMLQPGWTVTKHKTFQLNPLIAKAFEKAGLVEDFGTGITKVVDACRDNGNPAPLFEVSEGGKNMTVTLFASKLYLAIRDNRERIVANGGFADHKKVLQAMESAAAYRVGNAYPASDLYPRGVDVVDRTTSDIPSHDGSGTSCGGKFSAKADTPRDAYDLLKENPRISYSQMAKALSVSRKTVARAIAGLREKGLVQFVGNPRNGEWKILGEYPDK